MNRSASLIFDARGYAGAAEFVQLVLVIVATAPLVGAVAERSRFFPSLLAPALLAGVIVPLAGRWAWPGGWLHRLGFVDYAGASVIHVTGGLCAAVGAIVIGARTGKYNRDGSSNFIPGHSAPMASVGVMLMLAGWTPVRARRLRAQRDAHAARRHKRPARRRRRRAGRGHLHPCEILASPRSCSPTPG
jgi:ammonia channel protein AmtB